MVKAEKEERWSWEGGLDQRPMEERVRRFGQKSGGGEEEVKRRAPARTAACRQLNFEQACPPFIPSGSGESVRSDHELFLFT